MQWFGQLPLLSLFALITSFHPLVCNERTINYALLILIFMAVIGCWFIFSIYELRVPNTRRDLCCNDRVHSPAHKTDNYSAICWCAGLAMQPSATLKWLNQPCTQSTGLVDCLHLFLTFASRLNINVKKLQLSSINSDIKAIKHQKAEHRLKNVHCRQYINAIFWLLTINVVNSWQPLCEWCKI